MPLMMQIFIVLLMGNTTAGANPTVKQDSAAVTRGLRQIQQQMSGLQQELARLNVQFGAVHQEFNRLQKDSGPQRLPQRLAEIEASLEQLKQEVKALSGVEERLKTDLPWEIFSRLITIGTVLLSAMLALIGYFLSKQFVYQYLKENGIFDKLAEKAVQEVVPRVVNEVRPKVTQEATQTLVEFVGKFLRENTDLSGIAASTADEDRLEYKINGAKIVIEFGDLTEQKAQALVSSDDTLLHMAGGVARRIVDVGGQDIMAEAQKRAPIALGEVIVTGAGKLGARFIFHPAVIDISAGTYPDDKIIAEAVRNCLQKAEELKLTSISFPALGAGTGSFSAQRSAEIIAQIAREQLRGKTGIKQIGLVIFKKQHLQDAPRAIFDRILKAA